MEYELILSKHFKHKIRSVTSISDLAIILNCSSRYAKTIIRQLHNDNKIKWETSKGRGKKPFITVFRDSETILLDWMKKLWENGKYEDALEVAKRFEMLQFPTVINWINDKLGMQTIAGEYVFVQSMYEVELFLDPLQAISRHDSHMMEQIHETLFIMNEEGAIKNNLVFAYETKDYQTWSFVLRKGVLFHDGTYLTAQEAKQSIEYISTRYKAMFQIEKINLLNPYEFQVILEKPCALFVNFLASPRFVMLNKQMEFHIGCGPFQLKQLSKEKIVLETFQHYFKERPWIDRVELLITDKDVLGPIHYEPLVGEPYKVIEQQEEGATYLFINSQRPEFKNEINRAFIWHAINPEEFIINTKTQNVSYGWVTSRHKLHIDKPTLKKPAFNKPLRIGYQQIREGTNHYPQAEKLQQLLGDMGIKAELCCIDFQNLTDDAFAQIDLFIGGNALLPDWNLSFYLYYATYGQHLFRAMNEEDQEIARTLFEKAKQSEKPNIEFYKLEHFFQTSYHVKFLYHRRHFYYVRERSNFAHVTFDTNGRINYRQLYITEKR